MRRLGITVLDVLSLHAEPVRQNIARDHGQDFAFDVVNILSLYTHFLVN